MCSLNPVRLLLTLLTVALEVKDTPPHSNLLQVNTAAMVYQLFP